MGAERELVEEAAEFCERDGLGVVGVEHLDRATG